MDTVGCEGGSEVKGLLHIAKTASDSGDYIQVEVRTDIEVIRINLSMSEYARLTFGEAIECEVKKKERRP